MKTLILQLSGWLQGSVLPAIGLLLASASVLPAAWTEKVLTGSPQPQPTAACFDQNWNIFFYGSVNLPNKLRAVYQDANGTWVSTNIATNFQNFAGLRNEVAVDSNYHWVYYVATDGLVHVAYWTGSAWTDAAVGSVVNSPAQFCVDSVYHHLYYVNASGHLWVLYWNGSAWIETALDTVIARNRSAKASGVDEVAHTIWHVSADRKKLVCTYWNGSAWVSFALPGESDLSATANFHHTIGVSSKNHLVYSLQLNAGYFPQKFVAVYWQGSAWVAPELINSYDTNFPTGGNGEHIVLPSSQDYSCCYGGLGHCRFTAFSTTGRAWMTTRLDTPAMGLGSGLQPIAVGYNGRAILCYSHDTANGASVLWSDLP